MKVPLDSEDLVDILEGQKKEAIAGEDFRAADALKQQIDRLRRSYDEVMVLQRQKSDAVKKEDFAAAPRLKNEIDQVLNVERSSDERPLPLPLHQIEGKKSDPWQGTKSRKTNLMTNPMTHRHASDPSGRRFRDPPARPPARPRPARPVR